MEVEHRRCQQDCGAGLVEVLQLAGTAGRDDVGRRALLHCADHGQIVAGLGSVARFTTSSIVPRPSTVAVMSYSLALRQFRMHKSRKPLRDCVCQFASEFCGFIEVSQRTSSNQYIALRYTVSKSSLGVYKGTD